MFEFARFPNNLDKTHTQQLELAKCEMQILFWHPTVWEPIKVYFRWKCSTSAIDFTKLLLPWYTMEVCVNRYTNIYKDGGAASYQKCCVSSSRLCNNVTLKQQSCYRSCLMFSGCFHLNKLTSIMMINPKLTAHTHTHKQYKINQSLVKASYLMILV